MRAGDGASRKGGPRGQAGAGSGSERGPGPQLSASPRDAETRLREGLLAAGDTAGLYRAGQTLSTGNSLPRSLLFSLRGRTLFWRSDSLRPCVGCMHVQFQPSTTSQRCDSPQHWDRKQLKRSCPPAPSGVSGSSRARACGGRTRSLPSLQLQKPSWFLLSRGGDQPCLKP